MADLIGKTIKGYKVQKLIGQGGMGDVYYAIDTHSGQPVAVKRFKPEVGAGNPELLERFAREGEILRQLNHPNIVKVLATFEEDRPYLVMEYVGGGSLRSLLDREPQLPLERVISIALDLADALTRAHRLNIIHRDIKPANVLLAEDGTPRLTDFGIAHLSNKPRVTKAEAVLGTLDYLSPEALRSEGIDARTDIWSFGVMLFEMLAGRRPFDERTAAATALTILQNPVPDLEALRPDVPVALVDLIYRMLEKDRQARISSVRLVGAELEAISKGTDLTLQVQSRVLAEGRPVFTTPSTSSAGVPRHNLPAQTTPFIGRQAEVAELTQLLNDTTVRLVTVLGLGGMGKTRLALEVAATQLDIYEHGVYFVSLTSLSSADNIVAAVAEAINFHFYQGENLKQQLLDYLREKEMLLVMDSFDHVLDGAGLVSDILLSALDVKIMATSREKLNLHTETIFTIGGMSVPDGESINRAPEFDAVRLFVQSARRGQPNFQLEPENYRPVTIICHLVQGMPLGIELAAAWVEMLSLQEIADEISQSLDFLETEVSDIPERQRSIRAVFEYSWNRLDADEQELMQKLSVFRGSCTRKAAQKVTGASLQKLTSLVNRSLLRRGLEGRYRIQRLLRQWVEESLDQSPQKSLQARAAHAQYYAMLLDDLETPLRGAEQKAALAEISADLENIRTAWQWAVKNRQPILIGKALHSLYTFYFVQERGQEAEKIFELAVQGLREGQASEETQYVLGRVLARQGWLTQVAKAEAIFREGLALLRPFNVPNETAFALLGLGSTLLRHDPEQSYRHLTEGLEMYRAAGNRWGERIALYWLGLLALAQGRSVDAKQVFHESLVIAEEIQDRLGGMMCHQQIGNAARTRGEYPEATRYYQNGLAIAREIGVKGDIARAVRSLGNVSRAQGDYVQAGEYLRESLSIYKELGNRGRIARVLYEIGDIARTQQEYAEARALFEESLSINRSLRSVSGSLSSFYETGDSLEENKQHQYQERLYQEASSQEGEAYALIGLGGIACEQEDYQASREYYGQALRIASNAGSEHVVLIVLAGLAEWFTAVGSKQEGIELAAFVYNFAEWAETKQRAHNLLAALERDFPADVFASLYSRGTLLDLPAVLAKITQ